jgi:serine/threonine protein kinase
VGAYRIEGLIGRGGQSAVYRAHDLASGAPRALKELSLAQLGATPARMQFAITTFQREAALLQRLSHPRLVHVYELFTEAPDRSFIVMDFVEGRTLEDEAWAHGGWRNERGEQVGGRLHWREVVIYGLQLLDALIYLHAQTPPIVYRDMKPSNVMVNARREVTLIDFGVARLLAENAQTDTAIVGTEGYAAPEQHAKKSEPRSDLYGLGATLWRLLCGAPPESALARFGPLHPPADTQAPPELWSALERCLRFRPEERFPSAAALRDALSSLARASATPTTSSVRGRLAMAVSRISDPRANATPTILTPPPLLAVTPTRLSFSLLAGQRATQILAITDEGGGGLHGDAVAGNTFLSLSPTVIDPATTSIAVTADAQALPPGSYSTRIRLRTSGGEQFVPVEVQVAVSFGS